MSNSINFYEFIGFITFNIEVHELVYVFSFLVDRILVSCISVRLCVDIKSKNLKTFLKALVLSNLKNALSLFLGRRRISKGSPFQVEGPTIEVLGQNGSGQNGTDKMVWTKWYTDKMVLDKTVRTKWYGQNGTDKTLAIKSPINTFIPLPLTI